MELQFPWLQNTNHHYSQWSPLSHITNCFYSQWLIIIFLKHCSLLFLNDQTLITFIHHDQHELPMILASNVQSIFPITDQYSTTNQWFILPHSFFGYISESKSFHQHSGLCVSLTISLVIIIIHYNTLHHFVHICKKKKI